MGDYSRKLDRYQDVSTSYTFLAATDYTTAAAKIAAVTGWTIYVQKITLAVTTDNAATQTWQDSAGTPIIVAGTKASPGIGPITWDFGPDGFALTEGQSLDHKMSGAGMAGSVTITAYRKATATQSA
jgi:hypothetical protein